MRIIDWSEIVLSVIFLGLIGLLFFLLWSARQDNLRAHGCEMACRPFVSEYLNDVCYCYGNDGRLSPLEKQP